MMCINLTLPRDSLGFGLGLRIEPLIGNSSAVVMLVQNVTADAICKDRLRQRNISGEHPYEVEEPTYDLFMSHFIPPTSDEGFNVIIHTHQALEMMAAWPIREVAARLIEVRLMRHTKRDLLTLSFASLKEDFQSRRCGEPTIVRGEAS